MKFNEIASAALKLEPKERAELAGALWDSLEDTYLSHEELSDEEAIQLALQRSEEIDRGEVKPVSHTELMRMLCKDSN